MGGGGGGGGGGGFEPCKSQWGLCLPRHNQNARQDAKMSAFELKKKRGAVHQRTYEGLRTDPFIIALDPQLDGVIIAGGCQHIPIRMPGHHLHILHCTNSQNLKASTMKIASVEHMLLLVALQHLLGTNFALETPLPLLHIFLFPSS